MHTSQPVLSVNPLTGQQSVSYGFQVASDADFKTVVAQSPWLPNTTTWTVATPLADNQTYYWRARALYASAFTDWSASRKLRVSIQRLGASGPMWSYRNLEVNEANGNLVFAGPTATIPSSLGPLGVSLTYNAQDTANPAGLGAGWSLGGGLRPPVQLLDQSVIHEADAAEITWADGTSSFYQHIGRTRVYRAGNGQQSLSKNADGTWTLVTGVGEYFFGATNASGVAKPTRAEVNSWLPGKDAVTITYGATNSPTSVGDTVNAQTVNWSCAGALMCVTGTDGVMWKYVGAAGSSGPLTTVFDGVRNIVSLGYGSSGLLNSIKNADDLDPANAGSGYDGTHAIQIAYDANKRVTALSEGPVRNLNPSVLKWSFDYHLAGPYSTAPTRASHADGPAGTVRAAAGYTVIAGPQGTPTKVFFDGSDREIEHDDALGHVTEAGFDSLGDKLWIEDALGRATDYTWDTVDGVIVSERGPDLGGNRPTTYYRYDEKSIGDSTSAGQPLLGLHGSYYGNGAFSGRPSTDRTDANVDFDWGTKGPDANVGSTNYSVSLSGDVIAPQDGDYTFAIYTDGGASLVVDNLDVVEASTNTSLGTFSSLPVRLTAGKHRIDVEYTEGSTPTSHLHLLWQCADCQSAIPLQVIPAASFRPAYNNQTSIVSPAGRIAFTHYAAAARGVPDYKLTKPGDGTQLITSFSYDGLGRLIVTVPPRGNASRTIDGDGSLGGSADLRYATTSSYYAADASAAPPGQCGGGSAVNQGGQLRSIAPPGIASTTYTYDSRGDVVGQTGPQGTTCQTFDQEGRRVAITDGNGHTTKTTFDPSGRIVKVTAANGAVTASTYDERGLLVASTDADGRTTTHVYDRAGNDVKTVEPTGASTVRSFDAVGNKIAETDELGNTTTFAYDAAAELTSVTQPLSEHSTMSYDALGHVSTDTDARGHTTSYQYDLDGNKIATTDALGNTATTTYDGAGRRTATTDADRRQPRSPTTSMGIKRASEPRWGASRSTPTTPRVRKPRRPIRSGTRRRTPTTLRAE